MQELVLIHGFTGSAASWEAVRRELPSGIRVRAAELLGHGGAPDDAASFEAEVDRLAQWLGEPDPARDARRVVAGYSLGGRVALGLLVRHGRRFGGAVILSAHPGLEPAARSARVADDERWARLLEAEGLEAFLRRWEALPLFASQRALPPATREGQRAIRAAQDARRLARSLRVLGLGNMPDWRPLLAGVEVPVTLVAGGLDEKFDALGRSLARTLPRARYTAIGGAGHNPLIEAPVEVARIVSDHLLGRFP